MLPILVVFFERVETIEKKNLGILFSNIVYKAEIGMNIKLTEHIFVNLMYNRTLNSILSNHDLTDYSDYFANSKPLQNSFGVGFEYGF